MPEYYDEDKEKIINLAKKIPKIKFNKTLLFFFGDSDRGLSFQWYFCGRP